MSGIQDRLFLITQLIKVTEKEARYLTRTANRLSELNINLSWVESLDNNDLHIDVLINYPSRQYTPPIFAIAKETGIQL